MGDQFITSSPSQRVSTVGYSVAFTVVVKLIVAPDSR